MNCSQLNINQACPLISVVLPAYNAEKYVREAVQSILAQSFTNFELIIINDGSTDGTLEILEKLRDHDSRVTLISRENKGLVESLNEGIDLARGMYLARMDADDIALPYRFERQLEWLEQTGADICGSWVRRFGTSDNRVVRFCQSDEAIKMKMLFCSPLAHPTVIMRTTLIKQLRYDKVFLYAQDYDLWSRAAEAALNMTNVQEVLLFYRVHAEQISTKTVIAQQQEAQVIRLRYLQFMFHSLRLNRMFIDETLKLFDPSLSQNDMDAVNYSFTELLSHSHGESRDVVFDNLTLLYLKAATKCKNIVSNWDRLNSSFGRGRGVATKFQLWLFRLFRIRADGVLFKHLRKIYLWRASR